MSNPTLPPLSPPTTPEIPPIPAGLPTLEQLLLTGRAMSLAGAMGTLALAHPAVAPANDNLIADCFGEERVAEATTMVRRDAIVEAAAALIAPALAFWWLAVVTDPTSKLVFVAVMLSIMVAHAVRAVRRRTRGIRASFEAIRAMYHRNRSREVPFTPLVDIEPVADGMSFIAAVPSFGDPATRSW